MGPVSYTNQGGIAVVTIDHPPVNAMSTSVRAGLLEAVIAAEADSVTHGIIRCEGRTFVAGGDISEFGKPPAVPHLPDVYQRIEDSPIVWLAAMYGTVLGGGFELAMACNFRVALAETRFGLPEVLLGLIPGAGGTQRLPRLVGVPLAADLCSSGRMISASELLEAGGLDAIVSHPLDDSARSFLTSPSAAITTEPVSQRPVATPDNDFSTSQRELIAKKSKGAEAPLHNLDAVQWTCEVPFSEGQPRERALHLQLRDSAQSTALRHVFFAERAVSKPTDIKDATARPFNSIAIVGGGLMGSGIAAACLSANLQVRMIETQPDVGKANVDKLLQGALSRNKITEAQYQQQLERFECDNNYALVQSCDITIEAVFEDLNVKQQVFEQLAAQLSDDAIIATNTSYLSPMAIAQGIANPSRIVGLHFFSPAHIMKLLEIVKTPDTSPEVLATAFAFARKIKKTGVLAGICDGFIGNRMLAAYRRQADYLLADGAAPKQIDQAMRSFGMPMGPYELQDLTGLQIGYANRQRLAATRSASERYVTIADQLCEAERFGQRSGAGWYLYEGGSRQPVVDPFVTALIDNYRNEQGNATQAFDDTDIQQRLLVVLANEGERILEEHIAERSLDIDLVKIHGYGFPRWSGGPMHVASQWGQSKVRDILQRVSEQSPGSWIIADKYR
ncbi:MAG: 3-hydroxyacyl-CoA dehydrogenase NAD-binding domain-containing protein [Pseudomonadota bacterium]